MALIPNVDYIYSDYKDQYTIENISAFPLTITLTRIECNSTEIVSTRVIPTAQKISIFQHSVDGNFTVGLSNELNNTASISIKYYYNLIVDIIRKTEQVLCGCKDCDECTDCNDCQDKADLVTLILSYFHLNTPVYNPFLQSVITVLSCTIDEQIYCYELSKIIKGEGNLDNLLLKTISMYYLSFYYTDLGIAGDEEEKIYTSDKYKSSKILKCIQKLGVDISDIIDEVVNPTRGNVYFWQGNGTQEDVSDILPLISEAYLDTKPFDTYINFETGREVDYSQVGRYVFFIEETGEFDDILIRDYLLSDVTGLFDIVFIPYLSGTLVVSKDFYIPSTQFFKFKITS